MQRLADRLDVRRAAVHRHFSSREALIAAVGEHVVASFQPQPIDAAHWRAWLKDAFEQLIALRCMDCFLRAGDPRIGSVVGNRRTTEMRGLMSAFQMANLRSHHPQRPDRRLSLKYQERAIASGRSWTVQCLDRAMSAKPTALQPVSSVVMRRR